MLGSVNGMKTAPWGAVVLGLALVGLAGPAGATHYPPGALCYDCHAVSAGKMVPGTHLIKRSQKTLDLGITETDPAIRCLFCHEEKAVSVVNRDRMKGVYHDFDATPLSKHPVDITKSTFTQDTGAFDCLDCHAVTGLSSDGAGNANVHGKDASTELLDVYSETLIGAPLDGSDAELSTKTCQNADCHSATGTTLNGYTAPPRHSASNTKITLNDAAQAEAQVYCTKCHGKHASPDGEVILVIRNTSGNNGRPPTNATVALTECDVCHVQDENGGLTDNFGLYGHGKMGVTCDGCHELRHDVDGDGAFDPAPRLRAALAVDTSGGTSTFGTSFYANCRKCHAGHAPHTPSAADGGDPDTGRSAGCMDCHDQHGTTAADATFQNDTMIRRTVAGEDTRLADDDVKYNGGWYVYGRTDAPCDNEACHTAIPAGQSLNDDGAGGTNHLGGAITSTTCASGTGCHDTHASRTYFGAAQDCNACHGFPPSAADAHPDNPDAVGVHDTHVNKIGYGCAECHYGNAHNESGWGSDQGTAVPAANVDVGFNPGFNPSGAYDPATNTCSDLTCHNPDDPTIGITGKGDAGQTQRSAPVWLDAYQTTASTEATRNGYPANTGNWEIGDTGEECEACHVNSLSSNPDGGNHWAHDNPDAPQKNYPCRTCHAGEDSATNAYSGDHARGTLTDPALVSIDPSVAGLPVTGTEAFADASSTCSNVYCHGATLNNGGVTQAPVWTDDTTGDCGTCHGVFGNPASTPTPEKVVTSNDHPTHYTAARGPRIQEGHGGTAPGCSSCHNSIPDFSTDCSSCHGNGSQGALGPGATTPSPTHVDGKADFTGDVGLATTTACDNCHSTAAVNGQVGRDLAKSYWPTAGTIPCVNCHNGTDPGTSLADGTGRTAPDVLGNDTSYGAEVTGHNLATGTYPASGNPAAAKACADCHDEASTHVNNADDTTFAGNRLLSTVNTVATGDTVSGLCGACHQTTAGTPAQKQVSTHGNQNASFTAGSTHDPNAEEFVYNCEACHEPHGMTLNANANPNIYMVRASLEVKNYSVPSTGADRTTTVGVVFEARSGTNSFDDGATQSDNMCVACHIDANRPGSATALTNTDGNHSELDDYTGNEQGNDCSGCHAHNFDTDAGGTADGFMPGQCDGCHGYPPATNAHAQHVDVAGVGCGRCHQNGGLHNETGVADAAEFDNLMSTSPGTIRNAVDVVFDAFNPNGAYSLAKGSRPDDTTTYGTCNTLYCHGDDTATFPSPNGGSDTTPEWNDPATGACGTCHGATAGAPPRSNAHLKHTSSTEYGYGCNLCHVATTADGTTIASASLHVNGLAEVAFDTSDPRLDANSAYGGDTAVGTGFGACTQTYCHSQGNDLAAPFGEYTYTRQKGVSGTWTPITWDNPNGSCSKCHGYRPDYADLQDIDGTPKGNKHEKHVGENLYSDCGACHYTTYKGKGGGFNPATHVNMVYNVDVDPVLTTADLGYFTFTAGAAGINGTCATTNCHGGRSGIAWDYDVGTNGHFTCDVCHATTGGTSSTADVNDFVWDNTGAQSKVSQSEYTGSGHGAKGVACAGCHDSNVPHDSATNALQPAQLDGTNPFRLVDQDAGTAGVQFSCSYTGTGCHEAGTIGPATGLDISTIVTHSPDAMTAAGYTPKYAWSFSPDCVNCHDPHGDDANLSMVQRELYDKAAFGLPAGPPPAEPTEQTALAFTDDTTGQSAAGTSYADSDAPFSSICQECHEGTPGTDTPYAFVDDTSASVAPHPGGSGNPGDCSDCHPHNKAFSPSCDRCHGSVATGQYWPDGTGGVPAYADDEAGAHDAHVLAIGQYLGYGDFNTAMYTHSQQVTICAFCHPDPGGSGHTVDSGDQRVDLYGGTGAGDYFQAFLVGAGAYGDDTHNVATYNATNRTCDNVDCHYERTTPVYDGAGWDDADLGPNNPTCETCHFFRQGPFPTIPWQAGDLPDAHQVHVAGIAPPDAAQSHAYACVYCHTDNGGNTAHTNGQIDLDGSASPKANGDEVIAQPDLSVKYGAGTANATCSGFYCHGADFSAQLQGTDVTPVWNDHTTAYCSTCHDVDTRPSPTLGQEFDQGKHKTHASPGAPYVWGPPYSQHAPACTVCHGVVDGAGALIAGCGADACHPDGGFSMPGSAGDEGWSSFPSRDHVEGLYRVDFEGALDTNGANRGWNDISDYNGTPGTLSTLGNAFDNGTDICNRCHSTATVGGQVGATLAKLNWDTASYRLPDCLLCHNQTDPADSTPVTGGVAAPAKDAYYAADDGGHGYGGTYTGTGNTGPGYACTVCHDQTSSHISGTLDDTDRLQGTFTEADICADCHQPGQTAAGTLGYDATVEASNHSAAVSGNYGANTAYDYTCTVCHDPHGTSNIAMINTTIVDGMGADATGVTLGAETGLDPTTAADDGVCDRCHQDAGQPHANTGRPGNHNQGQVCIDCHDHTESFKASCVGCHDGSNPSAPQVVWPAGDAVGKTTAYGSHLKQTTAEDLSTVSDWDAQCKKCHAGHTGVVGAGVDVPLPPSSWDNPGTTATETWDMRTRLGIDYTANGGIHVGGSATSGTTEAGICWGCHDGTGVSEWGVNNNPVTGGLTYDYGSLDTSDWTAATWTSAVADFSYKTGAIQSTHSVNFTSGTAAVSGTPYAAGGMSETVDNAADIRCTYCHDVHDLNKASGDSVSGQPYLRGTWKGNPYNEDGAPQASMDGNWTEGGRYGLVPRGSASPTNNNGVGGYWIDQNSNNPNDGETLASTAGLCTLCHGTDVDTMDYTTGENLWVGTNGHSNAVIGGTGSAAVNIFRNTLRGGNANPANTYTDVSMGLAQATWRAFSYRATSGYGYTPYTNPSWRPYAYTTFEWGTSAGGSTPQIAPGTAELVVDETTLQIQYHTFNCGKCHNPHASRLPKLMITNCLDNNHNTWQDLYQVDSSGGATDGERLGNWLGAQNCHRRGPREATGATGSGTDFGPGWNKVTPW